jgi:hypothetical protein
MKRKMALMTLYDTRRAVMLPIHIHRAKKLPRCNGVTDVITGLEEVRL